MNEKLHQCVGLVELLRDHLKDKHHTRLELMIIILIMIEVYIRPILRLYSVLILTNFVTLPNVFGAVDNCLICLISLYSYFLINLCHGVCNRA